MKVKFLKLIIKLGKTQLRQKDSRNLFRYIDPEPMTVDF